MVWFYSSFIKGRSMKNVITVSVLIENEKGEILFLQEKDKKVYGKYNLPGGHLELNETLLDCAVREVKEETGIVIEPEYLIGFYQHNKRGNGISFVFLWKVKDVEPQIDDNQILSYKWFKPDDFLELDEKEILNPNKHYQILKDFKNNRKFSLDILRPIIYDQTYE